MKLYLLSATVFFFLFLVFFVRRFPSQNIWFAAWLLMGVAVQAAFAVLLAIDKLDKVPSIVLDILGWVLIGLALLHAAKAKDEVNQIIYAGLGAMVLLTLVVSWFSNEIPEKIQVLASNLAGLGPATYMLVKFSTVYSDWLTLASLNRILRVDDWRASETLARVIARWGG